MPPGAAWACSRAAKFTASPKIWEPLSKTSPICTAMRSAIGNGSAYPGAFQSGAHALLDGARPSDGARPPSGIPTEFRHRQRAACVRRAVRFPARSLRAAGPSNAHRCHARPRPSESSSRPHRRTRWRQPGACHESFPPAPPLASGLLRAPRRCPSPTGAGRIAMLRIRSTNHRSWRSNSRSVNVP